MFPYLVNQDSSGFDFLQSSIPVVLLLALILMIVDAIIEVKSSSRFKSH